MEIMITAGEASGDAHAAELIIELRQRHPEWHFFGCGGEAMAAAGCELLVTTRELAVMGLTEVLTHLPRLYQRLRRLRRALRRRKPAAIILVDFPDFNMRLAKTAQQAGVPALYFISPQLWAWRERRVKLVRRYIRRMICIFPFEQAFYARHGVEAAYVGHPMVERIAAGQAQRLVPAQLRLRLGIEPQAELIALLPGSRRRELSLHLDTLLKAAALLRAQCKVEFVLPVAPTLDEAAVRAMIPPQLRSTVHVVAGSGGHAAVAAARLALVASGTATVETALLGTPMVVFYRLSPLSYWLGRRLVRTPHIAMVNLIAGKTAVPELVQEAFHPGTLVAWVNRLLPDSLERHQMVADLTTVRERLGNPGAIARTADVVEQELGVAGNRDVAPFVNVN